MALPGDLMAACFNYVQNRFILPLRVVQGCFLAHNLSIKAAFLPTISRSMQSARPELLGWWEYNWNI